MADREIGRGGFAQASRLFLAISEPHGLLVQARRLLKQQPASGAVFVLRCSVRNKIYAGEYEYTSVIFPARCMRCVQIA